MTNVRRYIHFWKCLVTIIVSSSIFACSNTNIKRDENGFRTEKMEISNKDPTLGRLPDGWRVISREKDKCPEGWTCSRPADLLIEIDTGVKNGKFEFIFVPSLWYGFRFEPTNKNSYTDAMVYKNGSDRLIVRGAYKAPWNKLYSWRGSMPESIDKYFRCKYVRVGRRNCKCSKQQWCQKKMWQDEVMKAEESLLADGKLSSAQMSLAARTCFKQGTPCIKLFRQALENGDSQTKMEALTALSCLLGKGFITELKDRLFDPDKEVAKVAGILFSIYVDSDSSDLLMRLLEKSKPGVARNAVIRAVGNAQLQKAKGIVLEYLKSTSEKEEAAECIRTLGLLGVREALDEIEKAAARIPGSSYYSTDAKARLKKAWGVEVDGYRMHLGLHKWRPEPRKRYDLLVLIDIRNMDNPEDRPPHKVHSREYEIIVDNKVIGRFIPHSYIGAVEYQEIEKFVGDLPKELAKKPGEYEMRFKLGNAMSNAVKIPAK
jgi:hypothetical protein